jgi:hypothetical protein
VTSAAPQSTGPRPFLVVRGEACDWAFDAERIHEVAARTPQTGGVPDLETVLGLPRTREVEELRFIALKTNAGPCWIRCGGSLAIHEFIAADVCALPAQVRRGTAGRLLAAVVFGKTTPVLVIDIEELGRISAERGSRHTEDRGS